MGFSLYSNPPRFILVVECNHGFVNNAQFGHINVESIDEIAHPEESIAVLEGIFIFTKTDAL